MCYAMLWKLWKPKQKYYESKEVEDKKALTTNNGLKVNIIHAMHESDEKRYYVVLWN